jgi:hypothetical protein
MPHQQRNSHHPNYPETNMADSSPTLANPVPASTEVATFNAPPQPVPLSKQQPPAPEAFTYAPTYPDGMELVTPIASFGGIVVETVRINGALFRRRWNTATGDGELRPLGT